MKTKIFLVIILALIVGACKQETTEIPAHEPMSVTPPAISPRATKTFSIEATSVMPAIASATNTPQVNMLDFEGIKSGQYVIVGDFQADIPFLYIISKDKQIVKSLSLESYLELYHDADINFDNNVLNTHFDVSSDGTQFLVMRKSPNSSYLLDVSTGKQTLLLITQECLFASWSPHKQFIALSCITNDNIGREIFILDTRSEQISQVTDCHDNYKYCTLASWSTNGHWLAYYQADERSGQHPYGIMVFNTSCFTLNNCMDEQMGLIKADSNPTWSLQNQLVYVQSGFIGYLELKNRQLNQVRANVLPNIPDADGLSKTLEFSPDGHYLAFIASTQNSVYLYSPSSNTFDLIFSSQDSFRWLDLIGWVTIP